MAYQRGSLKKVPRKEGDTWVLRYRVATADGRRVENTLPIGLVRDFPSEKAAWREVDTLGLLVRINSDAPAPGRIRFDALAEHYLRADFGQDAVRPKTEGTTAKHPTDCPTATSSPAGEMKSPRTSNPSTFSAG